MKEMKVLIITKSLTGGGAERVATNLAGELAKYVDVKLVVFNAKNNTYGTTVPTVDLHIPEDKGKNKILWHWNAYRKVKEIKKEFRPTHSISFLAEPDLANVLTRDNEKIIISVRNKRSGGNQSKFIFMKNKWVFSQADKIIALSQMVRYDLINVFGTKPENVVSIYNPCYTTEISEKIRKNDMTENERVFFRSNKGRIVITAGRLSEQKGQWHLIRAFKSVIGAIPEAKLVILGQGNEEKYLKELIVNLGLEKSVRMLGYKANPYVYLYNSDLFAFPSIYEGLGNVLIECMACALPIISADCPYGPKELLAPSEDFRTAVKEINYAEYGVLVPPMSKERLSAAEPLQSSEENLANAIINLLCNDELRMQYKEKILKRGLDFSPDIITKQWLSELQNME